MMHEAMKNYFAFLMLLLACGGGCMSMPYSPSQQADLKAVGLDDHTRARLLGHANPRPSDPEPTTNGLNGSLGIVPMRFNWGFTYGHTANITPDENATDRLRKLEGIERVYNARIDLADYHEAVRRGEAPAEFDLMKKLMEDAKQFKTDLLLIYTTGHNAKSFDLTLGVGQILLLGYCPTVIFTAEATTTAVLMDAKTGFIYATTEGRGDSGAVGIGWSQAAKKAEVASRAAEESFDQIVDRLEEAWPTLQSIYP